METNPSVKHSSTSNDLKSGNGKKPNDAAGRALAANLVDHMNDRNRGYSLLLSAQSLAYQRTSLNRLGWLIPSEQEQTESLAPFPSELRRKSHPAIKWEHRAHELKLVMSTGVPLSAPILEGQQWFIVDASWFKLWLAFVSSSRRMSCPGPIDNLWLINPITDHPYTLLTEDTDEVAGDFRRVTPQVCEGPLEQRASFLCLSLHQSGPYPLMHIRHCCFPKGRLSLCPCCFPS